MNPQRLKSKKERKAHSENYERNQQEQGFIPSVYDSFFFMCLPFPVQSCKEYRSSIYCEVTEVYWCSKNRYLYDFGNMDVSIIDYPAGILLHHKAEELFEYQ